MRVALRVLVEAGRSTTRSLARLPRTLALWGWRRPPFRPDASVRRLRFFPAASKPAADQLAHGLKFQRAALGRGAGGGGRGRRWTLGS